MALIGKTMKEIQAEREKEYQKLKKRGENMDLVNYSIKIPKHIHLKLKKKLAGEDKVLKDIFMKVIMDIIDEP